jgi:hypothetical protein
MIFEAFQGDLIASKKLGLLVKIFLLAKGIYHCDHSYCIICVIIKISHRLQVKKVSGC